MIDANYRVGNTITGAVRKICFYAEAQKPVVTSGTIWGGNMQARITDNGGDKTVNFHANSAVPSAVTLSTFTGDTTPSPANVMFIVLGLLGLTVLVWRMQH